MPTSHAPAGPSGLPRIIRCPGSMAMCAAETDRESTEFSAEGTAAHHIRDLCSSLGTEPHQFIGNVLHIDGFDIEVTREMADYLQPGLDRIESRPGRVVNEFRVKFDRWMPGQFGTLDVGIIAPDLIEIDDLKSGAGKAVSAKRNEPMMAYALGLWENVARHETKATEFLLVVDQPRARGKSDGFEVTDTGFDPDEDEDDDDEDTEEWGGEWRVSLEELLEFGETMKTAFDRANSPDAWLRAGHIQCQFCAAKGRCPEYARWSLALLDLEIADLDPSVITLRDKDSFTPQQRVNVATNMSRITAWTKAVYASVLRDGVAGRPIPGAKVVIGGQGPRKWADEVAAEEFVRYSLLAEDAFTPPKLISPAQFEKLKKLVDVEERAKIKDYVTRAAGKPSLVPINDRRPGYSMADEWDDD